MNSERFAEFLGVFVDVAREGNFSRVARKRGMTPSSVARQVDVLEAYLDNKLFLRSTRTLSLTDAGQVLLRRAPRILDELADVQQEIASMKGEIRGVLRVGCLPTFGKKYLIPVIATLAQKHPDLRVNLDLHERLGDPITERLDAVIRIGELADSTLIAIPIATQTRVLCASRGYLERSSEPRTPAELLSHRLLDKTHGADLLGWAEVLGSPIENDDARAVFRSDDFDALRLAALAGLGMPIYRTGWLVQTFIAGLLCMCSRSLCRARKGIRLFTCCVLRHNRPPNYAFLSKRYEDRSALHQFGPYLVRYLSPCVESIKNHRLGIAKIR